MRELYFSTDIEADGPIPGDNSMLSLGTVVFTETGEELGSFSANLLPLPRASSDQRTMTEFWSKNPDAWLISTRDQKPASKVIHQYIDWVKSFEGRKAFVAYPTGFDFTFVYWYCHHFTGECPFGFQAIDMESFTMALLGLPFKDTTKQNMPPEWFPKQKHTHVAIEDAREQGLLFINQLKASYLPIETENYCLKDVKRGADWSYFLQNKEGEGMSLSSKDLDCILDDYFKEHF